ncbi:Protein TolB [Candidatus Fokinia solitaria]|uniref:Protein TolB n=1 Tax=Candidatus Fokinia solitaria TaxID=1802984 RepID=A0A2U8BTA8_9RICK|nr:PD40 domain-containing protein [Candidatus Fokinia solitaria]AWD33490.1 Protein TolB [Candidatus Fokinia solitaria]
MLANTSHAVLELKISQNKVRFVDCAIFPFHGDASPVSQKISTAIAKDLSFSGIFSISDPRGFLENVGFTNVPNFHLWQKSGTSLIILGRVERNKAADSILVSYKLFDVKLKKQVDTFSKVVPISSWREVSHAISNRIYRYITGQNGYFATKVAFVKELKKAKKQVTKLVIADYNGDNAVYVTNGKNIVHNPQFSPCGTKLYYIEYWNHRTVVMRLDLENGSVKPILSLKGTIFSINFSPDMRKMIFSIAYMGTTGLYEYSLSSGKTVPLLSVKNAIITNAQYSYDGTRMVFTSDHSGINRIYSLNSATRKINQISTGSGQYFTPSYSPDGNYIAFSKRLNGMFYLGIMNADGSEEKLLNSALLVDNVAWAPNGSGMMFSARKGNGGISSIYFIDINGNKESVVATHASSLSWNRMR